MSLHRARILCRDLATDEVSVSRVEKRERGLTCPRASYTACLGNEHGPLLIGWPLCPYVFKVPEGLLLTF